MSKFSESAMLVSLNVRCYSARREDKKVTREVADAHNTSSDAGKYNKQLVAKTALDPIVKAMSAMRLFHYENTLPWLDEGTRVLPAANFQRYKSEMVAFKDAYDSAVADFTRAWPEVVAEARVRLNGLFNASDYPLDVSDRFGCRLRFLPVPDAGDFRVQVSDLERDAMKRELSDTMQDASQVAMRDLWARVSDAVKAMADKLSAYRVIIENGKQKTENIFRDSLVENLRDLVDLLPRLNFANDPRLDEIAREISAELTGHSAQELRDVDPLREDIAAKAQAISDKIAEFMV